MENDCRRARRIINAFCPSGTEHGLDRVIPASVLKRAKGFAIFTVFRVGFLMSARMGSGIVVARLPDGSWSAPSAIGIGGLGGGFNAGAEMVEFLIVLNSRAAVRSFMSVGSLQLGGNLSLAVGPLGRSGEASASLNADMNVSAMFSYSVSRGLYGGVTIEGTVLMDRADANAKVYGHNVSAADILAGKVDPPGFADPLLSRIEQVTHSAPGDDDAASSLLSEDTEADARVPASGGVPASAPRTRRRAPPPPRARAPPSARASGRAADPVLAQEDMDELDLQLQGTRLSGRSASHGDDNDPFAGARGGSGNARGLGDSDGDASSDDGLKAGTGIGVPVDKTRRLAAYAPRGAYASRGPLVDGGSGSEDGAARDAVRVVSPSLLEDELVVALHDFEAQQKRDLSFRAGDIIRVLRRTDNPADWWTGELAASFGEGDPPRGDFPSNYTEPV
ncbi:hypothetical protein MSPP1_004087 [Malassezia sp. CBS 17886]|nr:hypothetical protein MSPP1_004087 [Malassezia sp. CBS 17886]